LGLALTASIPARGVITVFAKTASAPRPRITSCEVKRTSSGSVTLVVTGEHFREGITATVGGVVPKKIKLKGAASTDGDEFTRLVLKGGICRGLPGDVVVTVPGLGSSDAFPCESTCR
jgi:hypothetical protein